MNQSDSRGSVSQSADLRTRIAEVISDELFKRGAYTEYGTDDEPGQWERVDGHINVTALADAVIREINIPDRIHTDDQGRTWEWCGGQPGTWAWRITANATADE